MAALQEAYWNLSDAEWQHYVQLGQQGLGHTIL